MIVPDAFLERLWLGMASHLWQSTLVLALLFVLALFLRRAPAALRHTLWLLALAKLLLPLPWLGRLAGQVAPGFGGWLASAVPADSGGTAVAVVRVMFHPPAPVAATAGTGSSGTGGLVTLLTVFWSAGALYLLLRWIRDATRSGVRMGHPLSAVDAGVRAQVEAALEGTGIPFERLVLTDDRCMPAAAGIMRPRILLPRAVARGLTREELRGILLHEEAHCRRRDPLWTHLQRLVQTAFFFHPLLWPLLRRLGETAELACDERVIAAGVPATIYQRALARALHLGLVPSPASTALHRNGRSLLQRRLESLSTLRRTPIMRRHRLILTLGAALVAVFSFLPFAPLADTGSPATPALPGTAADPAHPVTGITVEELAVPAVASDPVPPGLPEMVWVRVAVTVALDDQARPVDAISVEPMLHGEPGEEPVAPEVAAPFLKAAVQAALDSTYRFLEPPVPTPRAVYRGMFQLNWAIPGGRGQPAFPFFIRGDSAAYADGVLAIRGPSEDKFYLREGPSVSYRFVEPGRAPAAEERLPAPPRPPRLAEPAPASVERALPAPPAPPHPPEQGVFTAGIDATMPTLIPGSRAEPVYPEEARKEGVAGNVIIEAIIGEDGTVGDIKVLRAPDPDAGLADAAIEAIKKWRYEPAEKDGRPVAVRFTIFIEFRLDSQKPEDEELDPGLT